MEGTTRTGPAGTVPSEQGAYDELQCYTLAHGGGTLIHQHVVDAWSAQHADGRTKPIELAFALVGLYLPGISEGRNQGRKLALKPIQIDRSLRVLVLELEEGRGPPARTAQTLPRIV